MDGMSCMSYVAYGSARRIRTVPPESARSHYSTQAPGEQRASASPSPPLEERAGERRPSVSASTLRKFLRSPRPFAAKLRG